MKKIDRYIIKQFIFFYITSFIGFITMLVVVDISGLIGNFAEKGNFFINAFNHYMRMLPFVMNLLLPIISVMAAIFTVIGLKRKNELVCILSSGISIHRVIAGMCGVLVLTIPLYIINSEIIKPYLSLQDLDLKKKTLRTSVALPDYVSLITANSLSDTEPVKTDHLTISIIERETGKLSLFLFTPKAEWDTAGKSWKFTSNDIIIKTRDSTDIDPEKARTLISRFDPVLFGNPERLRISSRVPSSLSIKELRLLNPSRHAEMELYHRITFPLIMFLLIMCTIPFSVDQNRNLNVFIGVGIGLAGIFLFYGIMYLAMFMGGKGMIPAWAAGTAPLLICTIPSVLIYRKIQT